MLADFGALGLASGAIFWLYLKMSKRMDDVTDNFQAQLRDQAQGHNDREAALRDRYDKVIATYNDERLEVIREIGVKLEVVAGEIKDLEALIKEVLTEMRLRKRT
tara:strand:+ start:3067 stop:3381 length:315 start_codon:yes stop_codon:yes gene_type:complete